jgi:hypothetical protein
MHFHPIDADMLLHYVLHQHNSLQAVQSGSIGPALIILFAFLVVLAFCIFFFTSPSRRTPAAPQDPERLPILPSSEEEPSSR